MIGQESRDENGAVAAGSSVAALTGDEARLLKALATRYPVGLGEGVLGCEDSAGKHIAETLAGLARRGLIERVPEEAGIWRATKSGYGRGVVYC